MSTPDTDNRTVKGVIEFRGRGLAAGGAVLSQDRAFRYSGSQVVGETRAGVPVSNLGVVARLSAS